MEVGVGYVQLNDETSTLLKDLEVRFLYNSLKWRNIEYKKGTFDFSRYDQELNLEKKLGFNSVRYLGHTSLWASTAPSNSPYPYWAYPPKDIEYWKRFIGKVVRRYPGREWSIWAEQDNTPPREDPSVVCFVGSPKDYFVLLKTAYEVAKNEDKRSRIGLGALVAGTLNGAFPTVVENGKPLNRLPFFEKLIELGSENYCDFVCADIFCYGYGGFRNFVEGIRKIRNLTKKPIMITETGARISHPKGQLKTNPAFHHEIVTPETQCGFLFNAYQVASEAEVECMFWTKLISSEWGLVSNNRRRHLSYYAFKAIRQGLLDE